MSIKKLTKTYTLEEYFALAAEGQEKYEFHQGEVFAMAGGTKRHNRIIANLLMQLDQPSQSKNCELYFSDVMTEIKAETTYVYPDLLISCDDRDQTENLLVRYPCLIIEVLSQGTENYDRGFKLFHYRQIESLMQYLLVSQDKRLVESFHRQEGKFWQYATFTEPEELIPIFPLGTSVSLSAVYDRL